MAKKENTRLYFKIKNYMSYIPLIRFRPREISAFAHR